MGIGHDYGCLAKLNAVVPGAILKKRYQVGRSPLAHRGMGAVWPAWDTVLQRPVIVKLLARPGDISLVERFKREALLTARLTHPGVPQIYDLDADSGQPYLVLEKIDGITLADLAAEQGPLPIAWVAAIGAQISAVLVAAQEIGLVHRDIKPSNAMLERSGAVKVLDFGLAAIHGDDRYSRLTESGQALGTVGYMAPEQIEGKPTDHRTDLYGLGSTLFDLLTGQEPFDGATTTTTQRRQVNDPPPRPSMLRPDTPPPIDDLIHALLATDPADRPVSAAEVYAALAPFAGSRPPIPRVVVEGDNAVRAYAAVVAGALPLGGSLAVPLRSQPNPRAEDEAERLLTAGEFRAAARLWRQLADQHANLYGEDHPQVYEWRLRAARAHLPLGEHSRALRQLDKLLARRIQVIGPDDPTVRELRGEIAKLRSEGYAPD